MSLVQSLPKKPNSSTDTQTNCNIVQVESESKVETILGCKIQADLKWHSHINEVLKKLKSRVNVLEHLKFTLPYELRKVIVEGIFISILSYCLPVFGGLDNANLNALQVLQNKAARIVTHAGSRIPRKQMFDVLQWMTVRQLIFYHSALSTYRIRQSREPEYLGTFMSRVNSRGNIVIPNTTLMLARKSYCYRASHEWNDIPNSIRAAHTIFSFKVQLRRWILDNVNQF